MFKQPAMHMSSKGNGETAWRLELSVVVLKQAVTKEDGRPTSGTAIDVGRRGQTYKDEL